jgi:SM-20-related protein
MPHSVLHTLLLLQAFNALINSYIDNEVGISNGFLSKDLAAQLQRNLLGLYRGHQFHKAGTGNKTASANIAVRTDLIYWLDRAHNNPYENDFFDLIDSFVAYLNSTCYTGITGYEFHYALYETGSFYKKHLDRFRNDSGRKYSMITYLNPLWQQGDGGELCIYQNDEQQLISPDNCKSIFFKSDELEHEVLVTNKPRMSITGWLKVG